MTGNVPAARVAFDQLKKGGAPIACLTAYTAPIARLVDPHVDLILVGDSLGMVVYGFANTLPVTLDMMIAHGAAVVRNTVHALVVVDLPFGTYEDSPRRALESALRVMRETGCQAVKLEGGQEMAETVAHLVRHGIPVQGHIGLMPQSVEKMGGFKIQGRGTDSSAKVRADAEAIAAAGAFSIVIEGTVEPVARAITDSVAVPTIGIGASPACDGQILVVDDILGLVPKPPRFAKRYADVPVLVTHAVTAYADDVRARRFPGPEHCFGDKA